MNQKGPVREALRATRLGSLKYDKYWLESGKVDEVLALCNRFDRTLTITADDERVITTSPKAVGSGNGLGGGEVGTASTESQTVQRSGESSVSSKTVETPSSQAISTAECVNSESTAEEKLEESLTEFERAVVSYETDWERRRKAAIENRMKMFRNQWEECQKKALSPPSPRSVSPVNAAENAEVPMGLVALDQSGVGQTEPAFDYTAYSTIPLAQYEDVTPPLPPSSPGFSIENEDYCRPRSSSPVPVEETPEENVTVESSLYNSQETEAEVSQDISVSEQPQVERQAATVVAEPLKMELQASRPSEQTPKSLESFSFKTLKSTVPAPAPVQTPAVETKKPSRTQPPQAPAQPSNATQRPAAEEATDPVLAQIRLSQHDVERFKSQARLNEYKRTIASYQRQKEAYDEFQKRMESEFCSKDAAKSTKGVRQELSSFVRTKINQLSSASLSETVQSLGQLLSGRGISFQGKTLSIRKHPQAEEFVSEFIARMLVKQAESVVSVKRDDVYPLAAVAVALWVAFPRVGDFLKAIINSSCVYTVPYIPARDETDSDLEYLVKLCYQKESNGEIEKQEQFLKRMRGLVRFWSAMMCTPAVPWDQFPASHIPILRSNPRVQHPMDFGVGWTYLVNLIHLKPRPDITATVMYEFFEMASHFLKRAYGRQFEKLLRFINERYMPEILAGSAPYARLKTFLDSGSKRFSVPEDYPRSWIR